MMRDPQRRKRAAGSRRSLTLIIQALLIQNLSVLRAIGQTSECPPTESIPGCPCYNFQDGLFLECSGATEETLRSTLQAVITATGADTIIQSLSVYELDKSIEILKEGCFPAETQIRHLQISHSSLKEISEDAFSNLRKSLESLALLSGRLTHVPQKALSDLKKLDALHLESNLIQDLSSYCFYGLKLLKLSLKSNQILKISEYAFAGLEDSLSDLDLAENKLKLFPMAPLRRLESLASLRLSYNEISELPDDGYSLLGSLLILDLSSNNFEKLSENCFRPCPILHTLSLYYNSIEAIHKDAFISLKDLESIDLSHNKIVFLDVTTFKSNERLRTIDLSHNHIHYIGGVFARLPELRELYLAENNILEIPGDAFAGSVSLAVVYLQQNAIRRIDAKGLASLTQLAQLHLSNNYIEKVPRDFLDHCENLSSLSLDGNKIRELQPGTFVKLHQLRELRLQDNQITEVKRGVFSPLPSLLELHLQNNAITDMETGALRTLNSLQHVNLQGNQLTMLGDVFQLSASESSSGGSSLVSIQLDSNALAVLHNDSLRGQASVRIMWLGHNKLTHLQAPLFRDLLLVERLYLTNNSISKIEDSAFQPMQALKFLELSMNKLGHVTARTFSELHKLEELYLQDNGLRRLDPYALTALKKLRVLDLANNHLAVLQDTMFQEDLPIETLNLKNCSITSVESGVFGGLLNLSYLNLEDNLITAGALIRLHAPGLRTLLASGNNFSHIMEHSLNGLPSLQELIIDDAQISKLPETIFLFNRNLARLHLNRNLLRALPPGIFDRLLSLREIRLDRNRFLDIPYSALANALNLEILTLSNNEIVNVDVASFVSLKYLRELDLSHNRIDTMSGFAIANLSHLLSVDLSHNYLNALPANFFAHSSMLRRVNLSENKFRQIPAVALSGQNLPGLAWLNLTRNPLNRIHDLPSEAMYPILQEIHISGTNLSIVTSQDFEAFPALQHLFLGQNCILRVSPGAFRSLPNLLTLHLGMNSLEILPKERLQGMEHLRILNLTHNRLKELEEFPKDLKSLQVLDLSYNQIGIVGKVTFKNLISLVELHLYGNWINAISSEAFKPLKKLRLLDLSRNYLENLPLNAFRPLETQIRSLRAEENPLHCGCESQELWEWLRDHQKLVGGVGRGRGRGRNGVGVGDVEGGLLKCEQPPELRGLVFLDLDPHAFCSAPLVLKLAIQDIQPFSVLVSWQSRNHSGLHGYQVAYHALDNVAEVSVRGKLLDPKARSVKLTKLSSDTRYLICVLGLGSWGTPIPEDIGAWQWNSSHDDLIEGSTLPVMSDSPTSRCTEVRTLDAPDSIVGDGTMNDRGGLASILTRRLGLIVGSCMGFVVFIVLISVLGYMKMKKQRAAIKRDQPIASNPPEYMSYRHFSLQSGDRAENPCPSFISNIGTTPLNS
uniref:chaoptin-like isoform X1 n=1 Tax=Vespula vulgaris TaxID=7454 RepID=UPI00223BA144|nr:chaoptin-like isoform X1 [Vespula vulgaris]XP_050869073.1 chaoptin-like isoform X1 [Vespula vulgaris]XP_050869074.1 chaoptin-like isoform X1 [Vespula vulgaris]XP_050869075.1 chaoptin-like isoform X1 [Vespula vulgaris]XP_050869076.1 chaoptin-like isoform X1 [Vespula vulgaris]XP_050869077.1 chaoptin-like isoform X1 [Vespula vulgaris]XP_050869078.1 chaoptin-like isoform X1 [Vespula vulgaris]XP_050869079.1 chaoptin-like isoform X1 [Vespula vulgaris]XP_050869080.1 chaoptin-like isoform X1 [Ve